MKRATRALAETLFRDDRGPPSSERLDWLVDELDDYLAQAGARAALVYGSCLRTIDTVAPLLVRKRPPFTRLDSDDRKIALQRLERGPFGMSLLGAKAVLCILYYEHPEVAAEIGYDGACHR